MVTGRSANRAPSALARDAIYVPSTYHNRHLGPGALTVTAPGATRGYCYVPVQLDRLYERNLIKRADFCGFESQLVQKRGVKFVTSKYKKWGTECLKTVIIELNKGS